jgi:hypothetical protein
MMFFTPSWAEVSRTSSVAIRIAHAFFIAVYPVCAVRFYRDAYGFDDNKGSSRMHQVISC